jgi:hypothetical protein
MTLNGPTLATKTDCVWAHYSAVMAAYNLEWAHSSHREKLPMIWYGPILTVKTNCL